MSQTEISLLIGLCTLFLSVGSSAFIAGSRWGAVNAKLASVEANQKDAVTTGDMQRVGERLARIEGMFELRLKDDRAAL